MAIDIEMPDGTIIEGVPEGTPKEEVLRRYQASIAPAEKIRPLNHLDTTLGIGETALQLGTGAVGSVAAGLHGIGAGLIPGGKTAAEAVESTQDALTFNPRTRGGQAVSGLISKPFEFIEQGADAAGDFVSRGTGSPAAGSAVKTTLLGAPSVLGAKGVKLKPSPKQQAAISAQELGYVVPPASTNSSVAAGLLEGAGGKIKTAQQASAKNQVITNKLVTEHLGLPEGAPITIESLSALRAEAGAAYDAVRNTGNIVADTPFRKALADAAKPFKSTAKDFPGLSNKEAVTLIEGLNKPQFAASSGIDAIRILRDKADVAFKGGDKQLGRSYKSAAEAIESVIGRDLARSGPEHAKMLSEFRQARAKIAQSYTVQNALEGGSVSAPKLAAQLKKGAPLQGSLAAIAKFADEFPKAARVMNESLPGLSPLDVITGSASLGAALTAGSAPLALPAAAVFGRPAIRAGLLSQFGQKASRGKSTNRPNVNKGLLATGSLASQDE